MKGEIKNGPARLEMSLFLSQIKGNWYWFAFTILLGLAAGLIYNKYASPQYEVSTSILVKTQDKNLGLRSLYKDLEIDEKNTGTTIQNEVGILSSFSLSYKTLQNLKWDISLYRNSLFAKIDLYQNEPFEINKPDSFDQIKNVPINIKAISEAKYELAYNSWIFVNGEKHKIQDKKELEFGETYSNKYFNFRIVKINGTVMHTDEEYSFVFNNLAYMAVEYQDKIDIKLLDKESSLINIKLSGDALYRYVDYLNALGSNYISFDLSEKYRMADNAARFIDSMITNIDKSLRSERDHYTDFRTKNMVVNLDKESSSIIDKSKQIESQTAAAQIKLEYYENLKKYLNFPKEIKNMVSPSIVGVTDPSLNSLVLKLNELYNQREVRSYTLQEKNPLLLSLGKEIEYTQKTLLENIKNLTNNAQIELDNLRQLQKVVYQQELTLPKKEQDYIDIKKSLDFNNELYTFLLQRRTDAGIMKASQEPAAQIVDVAKLETAKSIGHSGPIILLIGIIFGLILPLLILLLKNYFDNRIRTILEVRDILASPISGMICHNDFNSDLPVFEYPNSAITESFRNLRSKLYLLKNSSTNSKVISVNSTISGEGRGFVSSNLACIFAIDNKSVLLVDADLRKPRLHRTFNVQNEKGLANYLKGEANFDNILTRTKIDRVQLITSGPYTDFPSELLNNGKFESLIEEAKKRVDYIIIKSPPSSVISDFILIDKFAGTVIYLFKFGLSTSLQVQNINELINPQELNNSIVVLNNVSKTNGMNCTNNNYHTKDKSYTS